MKYGMVSFIGAGPGDPELITVKGRRLIDEADLVLYTGSLVPRGVAASAKPGARILDSAPMTLEETHALVRETAHSGGAVARVHTGDPALYGAVREQAALLQRDGIPYQIIPGVTAAFAAAAAGGVSLTVPGRVQSVTLTRIEGRTAVPPEQTVREMARHGGSLAVYLSAAGAEKLRDELLAGGLDPATPVLAAYRVGWPEQRLVWTSVAALAATVRDEGLDRQTVFLVLPGEGRDGESQEAASRLYAKDFSHGFRNGGSHV